MNVKDTLHKKLSEIKNPYLLSYPFNEDISSFIYTSTEDAEGYAFWKFKEKFDMDSLEELSNLINQDINKDLNEYCNSYWFLSLEGFYEKDSIFLTPIIPLREDVHFEKKAIQHYGCIQSFLKEEPNYSSGFIKGLIYIGMKNDFLELYFSNTTGEIYACDFDLNHFFLIEYSLSEFLEKITIPTNDL